MKIYLLDAICRECGNSEVPLFRVCYDNEHGQRRFEGPYCETCGRAFVRGPIPPLPEEGKPL